MDCLVIASSFRRVEQISAPIMSRFDLFFVVLDECDETADFNIAQHIIRVHQNKAEVLYSPILFYPCPPLPLINN